MPELLAHGRHGDYGALTAQPNGVVASVTRPLGRSPTDFLAFNNSRFPPSSAARLFLLTAWLTDLVDVVSFVHSANVIHRDIKPSNMILHFGRPMLIDFGVACFRGDQVDSAGTTNYASLNALVGGPPEFRDDWISLGFSLYSLYIGHKQFESQARPALDTILELFPPLFPFVNCK